MLSDPVKLLSKRVLMELEVTGDKKRKAKICTFSPDPLQNETNYFKLNIFSNFFNRTLQSYSGYI